MPRNFFWLVAVRFLFVLGVQTQAMLMGWQMYDMTRDPLQLGLIGLAEAIPALTLALPAGLLIDRLNPFRFYQMALLVSFSSIVLSWSANSPATLYIAALITGLARAFAGPSLNAFIPRLIPRDQYKRTSAFTSTAYKFGAIIGPGAAGILLGLHGYRYPYLLASGALVLGSLILIALSSRLQKAVKANMTISATESAKVTAKSSLVHELLVGAKFVWRHPLLLSALSLDMFAVLFGGVTSILPIYANEILHVGAQGLGWLRAAPSVGAIFTGLYLIQRPIVRNAGAKLLVCVTGFGICILVFGLSKSMWLSLAALALSGALDSVSMVIRGAIVQLCSPDHMRGRISAVNSIFIGSSNELGEFESGVAAKLLGTVPSVVFGGTMTLITVALVWWKVKPLRSLDLDKLKA